MLHVKFALVRKTWILSLATSVTWNAKKSESGSVLFDNSPVPPPSLHNQERALSQWSLLVCEPCTLARSTLEGNGTGALPVVRCKRPLSNAKTEGAQFGPGVE